MKKALLCMGLILIFFLTNGIAQSGNASLSGTITDSSGAVIPGAEVAAANVNTGVVTSAVSNSAGVYSFPSLLPGVYRISAAQRGFQTQTYTDVRLGNAAQVRLNFKLEVAGIQQAVEVSTEAERMILESSSSTGDVLVENTVRELPLVNNNALDLVRVMSGYVPVAGNVVFNANAATVGGVSVANLNLQRDGIRSATSGFRPESMHQPR